MPAVPCDGLFLNRHTGTHSDCSLHLNHTHGSSLKVYCEPVTDRNRAAIDRSVSIELLATPVVWCAVGWSGWWRPIGAALITGRPTCLADRPTSYRVPATIVATILLAPVPSTWKPGRCGLSRRVAVDSVWYDGDGLLSKCDLSEANLITGNVPLVL